MEKLSGIQKELENRCWKTSEKNSPSIVLILCILKAGETYPAFISEHNSKPVKNR